MDINKLTIQNFLTVSNAELKLKDRGLVLIQGENLDDSSANSNGSGKSSIVDSIAFALYGKTARGISGDNVVNNKKKKDTKVVVELTNDKDVYTITRYRKHKTGKNRVVLEVNGKDLTSGTDKMTQQNIETIVGCNYDVFCSSIYSAQDQMPDLPDMTDKELKVIVEQSAGIDKFEKGYEIAKDKLRSIKSRLVVVEGRLESANSKLADNQELKESAKKRVDEWQHHNKESINEIVVKAKEHREEALKLKKELDALETESSLNAEMKDVIAKIDSVDDEREKLGKLRDMHGLENDKLIRLDSKLKSDKKVIDDKAAQIKNINKLEGTGCTECGKVYTKDDLSDAVGARKKALNDLVVSYKELKARTEEQQKQVISAQERLSKFEANMTDISEYIRLQRNIQLRIDAIKALQLSIDKCKDGIRDCQRLKKEKEDSINPHLESVGEIEDIIENTKESIKQLTSERVKIKTDIDVYQSVNDVFSPSGVRSYILDTVTPFLNERTSEYLSVLTDGHITADWSTVVETKKGEYKDKFNISVINDKGAYTFNGLSGGEKRKVRLSCALALQDLASTRATKPINIFIGDEIDDALDVSGLERLMTILNEKAEEKGTLLIISHNDLSDWIRQSITVTKKDGLSTIEE